MKKTLALCLLAGLAFLAVFTISGGWHSVDDERVGKVINGLTGSLFLCVVVQSASLIKERFSSYHFPSLFSAAIVIAFAALAISFISERILATLFSILLSFAAAGLLFAAHEVTRDK